MVDQLVDLFHTTHHTKTQHVTKNRGRHCGDIQLEAYLTNAADPVPLVMDLSITHDRFGSTSDPSLNGHLHYPDDIDKSLNEAVTDIIRKYRGDYNHNPPNTVSFMSVMTSTSERLVNSSDYYSYRLIGKLTVFFQLQEFSLCNPPVDYSTCTTRCSNFKNTY